MSTVVYTGNKRNRLTRWEKLTIMRLITLIMLLIGCIARADTFAVEPEQTTDALNSYILYLEDPSQTLTIDDIMNEPPERWTQNSNQVFNMGYSSSTWWLKLDLSNVSNKKLERFLEISYPVLDYVDAYIISNGVLQQTYNLGDKYPFHQRPVDHRHFIVPLEWQDDETLTVFLAIRSSSSVQAPLTLWEQHAFYEVDQTRTLVQGIYYGIMFVMIMYNLFVYLVVGERNYLYYVIFVLCTPLFMASLNGYAFQYLWPHFTQWNDQAILVSLSGVVLFGAIFTYRFLDLNQLHATYRWIATTLICGAIFIIALSFYLPYSTVIRILIPFAALACIYAFICGTLRWRDGSLSARYYTVAWSALLGGGVILALNKFHILPKNSFTEYAVQIGSALEVILLSFALAERINQERRMRFDAQQEALTTERELRQAREEALMIQKRATESLEQRVRERTAELEELNRKLEELSATDQLTGLKNRRYMDQALAEEFARCCRYGHTLAVLLMDIDHFKSFNDTYGHLIGDECLKDVAHCVRKGLRWPSDRAARYGGEEFCVILPETDHEGAVTVAERIRKNVENLNFTVNDKRVPVTISIGIAVLVPTTNLSVEYLLEAADNALYKSKKNGRNQVSVHQP